MHIIIIGNGIAGSTAARYIRKYSDHRITMISDESAYPYARTALMYVFMGHMRLQDTLLYEPRFWKKNRIDILQDKVTRILPSQHTVTTHRHGDLTYDKLVIGTGSAYRKPSVPGVDLLGVKGLYHLADLEQLEQLTATTQQAVIVGGGLIGIELAEMLHSRQVAVTMLVRESNYWGNILPAEEAQLVSSHIRKKGIHLQLNTQLAALEDDGNGRVCAAITQAGQRIPCQLAGLTIGVTPSATLAEAAGIAVDQGITVDDYLQTSLPDIYAAGDCVQVQQPRAGRQPIEAVWFTGKLMGRTVAATLCGKPTKYDPGHWYNAAKFFDLTYQTYGVVPVQAPATDTFLWQDVLQEKSLRFAFDPADRQVLGIKALGISLRHRVADKMLHQRWPLEQAVSHLEALLFEPAFSPSPAPSIRQAFRERFPHHPLTTPGRQALQALQHT